MPLDKSGSNASIGRNVEAEENAGKPHDQAVAIALDTARRAGADIPPKKRKRLSAKEADHEAGESMKKEAREHKKGRGKLDTFEALRMR